MNLSSIKNERLLIYHNLNFSHIPDTRWILYTCWLVDKAEPKDVFRAESIAAAS